MPASSCTLDVYDHVVVEDAVAAAVPLGVVSEGRPSCAHGVLSRAGHADQALELSGGHQLEAGVVDAGEGRREVPRVGARPFGDHDAIDVADTNVQHGDLR